MDKIRVLIADDHHIIHKGVADILANAESIEIIGHAYNGEEIIDLYHKNGADIIFMDISMPKINGIEATRRLREIKSEVKVIALTQHEDTEYVIQFLKAGGNGYLLKNSRYDEFLSAIETVLNNQRYLNDSVSKNMLNAVFDLGLDHPGKSEVHLTRREIEIIQKIAAEKNNQEIAEELNISLRTVETHRRNIMQKLDAKSVVSLVKYAYKRGLL